MMIILFLLNFFGEGGGGGEEEGGQNVLQNVNFCLHFEISKNGPIFKASNQS